MPNGQPVAVRETDRIDVTHDYAMCAWARHFNVSEHDVRQAVAVKEHLSRGRAGSQAYREGPNAN
jgi:hypothetical protein